MQLIGHELSRIVYLTNVTRRGGGAFLPDVAQRVLQKYSFVKFPGVDELQKESQSFSMGKFQDFQIDDLKVYSDGIIVAGKCDTDILSAFVTDLFGWIKTDFGLEEVSILKPEMHFESGLVVKAERDLTSVLSPPKRVANLIEKAMAGATQAEYQPSVITFEADSEGLKTRRRPTRFSFERRAGVPFGANVFFSTAPLTSANHLALLTGLEGLAD
jgi:hypothetical protein